MQKLTITQIDLKYLRGLVMAQIIQNDKQSDLTSQKHQKIKHKVFFSMIGLLLISCSSTPPPRQEVQEPDIQEESLPPSVQINFDPTGSDSGNIEGLYTVHFGYDQSTLTDEAKQKLNQNAEWIRKNSQITLQVEGHCDQRGSLEYNLALGERRAQAVKSYLVELGASPDRLNIISFGEEKLLSEGDTEADHSQNRRVNFMPLR